MLEEVPFQQILLVKISDSGPGIPQEYLTKVFDPFFTTKEQGSGTGLGLNIVHRVVENYGGRIQIESVPGKGATFIVSLPVTEETEPTADTDETKPAADTDETEPTADTIQ